MNGSGMAKSLVIKDSWPLAFEWRRRLFGKGRGDLIDHSAEITMLHDHGPLARYVKLRVRMRRECRERFPRHRRWAIPTCITARAWRTCRDACRDRQLSVSFEIGGGGKRSRHSRRMRNLQFYVSGRRPIAFGSSWFRLLRLYRAAFT